ncbi:MAG: hypothetical protein PHF82_09920 [Lutispora sp.]|nr:hypothetical protein [Lutispora sp.]
MSVALAIICFLYIGILGFFIMGRLDRFISSGGFVKESSEDDSQKINADVVVYLGSNMLPPAWSFTNGEHLGIAFITEVTQIRNEGNFRYLFAFSDNDFENLMVSSIAKKQNGEIHVGAVCNDSTNKRLFDMLEIIILLPEQFNLEYLYSIINSNVSRKVRQI